MILIRMEGTVANLLDSEKGESGWNSPVGMEPLRAPFSVLVAPTALYAAVPTQFSGNPLEVEGNSDQCEIVLCGRDGPTATDTGNYLNAAHAATVVDVENVAQTANVPGGAVVPWCHTYYGNRNATYDVSNGLLAPSFVEDGVPLFFPFVNARGSFYNRMDQNIPFLGRGQEAILDGEGYGANGKEDEGEGLKRAARRTLNDKKPTGPAIDSEYFTDEYKRSLMDYWTASLDDELVVRYLTNGTENKKRSSYRKCIPTIYELQKEYLSPENFMEHEGKLFKWEFKASMRHSNYGGMQNLLLNLDRMRDVKEDWTLPVGCSLWMYLWDTPDYNKKASWNPWFYISKSTIDSAGNGLFAAREFQPGETIGFYVGNVVYKYELKWTEKASEEFLVYCGAVLDDDSRTMSLVNKKGFRVLVNPHYGADGRKIVNPPLLMGIHFMNDFSEIFHEGIGGQVLKEKTRKFNNVWVDDQGGVKANRRICVGEEILFSYDGKRPPHKEEAWKKEGKRNTIIVAGKKKRKSQS
jgi:hypothetical protein